MAENKRGERHATYRVAKDQTIHPIAIRAIATASVLQNINPRRQHETAHQGLRIRVFAKIEIEGGAATSISPSLAWTWQAGRREVRGTF
jgi:hypothetical protein